MANFNYSFSSGTGIEPYLLNSISKIFGEENAPDFKIDNLGFLNLLNSSRKIWKLSRESAVIVPLWHEHLARAF